MTKTPEEFAKRVETLKVSLVEQGRLVQRVLESAFAALFARDAAMARAVIGDDDAVDSADVAIEKNAVSLLADATRAGAQLEASQLRWVLTIVKINNELERIADEATEVAQLVEPLSGISATLPDTFRLMANSIVGILRDANSSLQHSDPNLAKVVLKSEHCVSAFKSAILRDAEERIARGLMSVDFAFRLHEMASRCEVVADHCTNIAEQVIYCTTGAIVRHTQAEWIEVGQGAK